MAKELPYFKFYIGEWLNGDITLEEFECQGLFINICAYYWQKDGEITLSFLRKRFRGYDDQIDALISAKAIKIAKDEVIISFLDEQMESKEIQKITNQKNGLKGGRPKKEKTDNKPNGLLMETESITESKAINNPKQTNIKERKEKEIIGEEIREENIGVDFEIKKEISDALILHFGFSEMRFDHHKRTIRAFAEKILNDGQVENFKNQFVNYHKYKELSKEKVHNFQGLIGTPAERFENGGWNAENWEEKINKFKRQSHQKTKFEQTNDVFYDLKNDLNNGNSTL